ncbi:MAG: hypothetical protein OEZ02_12925, partial [Anaerolineae bacterium]|nr:hypothetical protein [Anaerolineae bacterium]
MSQITPPPYYRIDEDMDKGYDPYVVRGLLGFIRPYTRAFLISFLLMSINSAAAVAGPYFVKVALDDGIAAHSVPALRQAVLLYLLVSVIQW